MKNCRQRPTFSKRPSPSAPIVHEQHVDKRAGGNIHGVYRAASGDIEQGFKESDEIIENIYKIPPMQHGHIEPHVVTALWEPSGKLVVHTPSQTPSPLQEQIAKVFKMPLNRVRVIVPFIGGGYGGKNHARIEPVVALLARKARRPVQWILTRDEVFLTGRRFGAVVKIKTGFKRDGRLWARKVEAWYDMGAYALSGPANTKNACYHRRRAVQHSPSRLHDLRRLHQSAAGRARTAASARRMSAGPTNRTSTTSPGAATSTRSKSG